MASGEDMAVSQEVGNHDNGQRVGGVRMTICKEIMSSGEETMTVGESCEDVQRW